MKLEIFKNKAGKFSWRWKAANGNIIATDHVQGYERKADMMRVLKGSIFAAWGFDARENRFFFWMDVMRNGEKIKDRCITVKVIDLTLKAKAKKKPRAKVPLSATVMMNRSGVVRITKAKK